MDNKFKFAVDVPNPHGEGWICLDYFETKEKAIKFAKDKYGADENGKICLISNL